MLGTHWRHWLKDANRSRSQRGRGTRPRRRATLTLIADALEERVLLAVPLVTDHGGSILQNVQVETVYWNWNTPALMAMANQLNTFAADVTNSQYWSGLAQYGVGFGSWSGEFDIAGAPPRLTLGAGGLAVTTNADVEAKLVASLGQMDANGNVLPVPNANTLYLVFMPPGDPFNFADSTNTFFIAASYNSPGTPTPWKVFGGQHAWNVANSFAYAVIPFPGPSEEATPTSSAPTRPRCSVS